MGKARNYINKAWSKRGYISNGRDAALAGKLGLAGVVAYGANKLLKGAADKINEYSPGRVIKKVVTATEKGVYNLDRTIEREIEKVPGGRDVVAANKGLVNAFWDVIPGLRGNAEAPRTQKFYERQQIPMPYAIEKKTVTETRVPPAYNAEAANQKGLLGSAGLAINALLGIYAVKEGVKYAYNKWRGKK